VAIRYLLDTNTASCIIKGTIPSVQRRLVKVPMAQLAISTVSEAELHYGMARRRDVTQLGTIVKEFLLRLTILPWDPKQPKSTRNFAPPWKASRWATST
jgi:tRNA(fMet)-specific endonuclease VapC